jgi:hypothetical protein
MGALLIGLMACHYYWGVFIPYSGSTLGRPFYNGLHYKNKAMSEALNQNLSSDCEERLESTLKNQKRESANQSDMEKR